MHNVIATTHSKLLFNAHLIQKVLLILERMIAVENTALKLCRKGKLPSMQLKSTQLFKISLKYPYTFYMLTSSVFSLRYCTCTYNMCCYLQIKQQASSPSSRCTKRDSENSLTMSKNIIYSSRNGGENSGKETTVLKNDQRVSSTSAGFWMCGSKASKMNICNTCRPLFSQFPRLHLSVLLLLLLGYERKFRGP